MLRPSEGSSSVSEGRGQQRAHPNARAPLRSPRFWPLALKTSRAITVLTFYFRPRPLVELAVLLCGWWAKLRSKARLNASRSSVRPGSPQDPDSVNTHLRVRFYPVPGIGENVALHFNMQRMKLYSLLLVAWLAVLRLNAQSTALTYQGRLDAAGAPVSGVYDLSFALFDSASAGTQVGGVLTNAATAVSNGLFTITLDFGNQFSGADRWLELGVRTNGDDAFATLSPRQLITATPYAVRASSALAAETATTATTAILASSVLASNISGTVADTQLSPNVALLNANNTFTGTNSLQDHDLRLRAGSDPYHALGYYGADKTFGGLVPMAPCSSVTAVAASALPVADNRLRSPGIQLATWALARPVPLRDSRLTAP